MEQAEPDQLEMTSLSLSLTYFFELNPDQKNVKASAARSHQQAHTTCLQLWVHEVCFYDVHE